MDVGQQPLGNYFLIRLLGQGGFADVYLGQHKTSPDLYRYQSDAYASFAEQNLANFVARGQDYCQPEAPCHCAHPGF